VTTRRRRLLTTSIAPALLVAILTITAACSTTPPRVALYGDSLSVESQEELRADLGGEASLRPVVQGGAALCDALAAIQQDLDRRKPNIAIIQFSGNNITSCMQLGEGEPLEGADLVAKYAGDAELAVALLRDRDVIVYLVGSPIAERSSVPAAINAEYRRIADRWAANGGGVFYVDAGASVLTPSGSYTETLPCRPWESADLGCEGGQIVVRAPDGIHFCPTLSGGNETCPVYSSGAERFAGAIATPVLDELDDGLLPGL
jgi:hypothetical protein